MRVSHWLTLGGTRNNVGGSGGSVPNKPYRELACPRPRIKKEPLRERARKAPKKSTDLHFPGRKSFPNSQPSFNGMVQGNQFREQPAHRCLMLEPFYDPDVIKFLSGDASLVSQPRRTLQGPARAGSPPRAVSSARLRPAKETRTPPTSTPARVIGGAKRLCAYSQRYPGTGGEPWGGRFYQVRTA